MLQHVIQRFLLTIVAVIILAVSLAIFALGSAGVLSTGEAWRILIVPAYLTMLIAAILGTALSLPANPVLWLVGVAVALLPFAALDWLRARLHRSDAHAA